MFDVRTIPGADKLNAAFTAAGFELRLVGGAVRDILLNETPKDFDFATDATPAEMKQVAECARFGCIATGEAHGTMTIVVDGEPFEVTTLRIDVETDGRRAEVEFTRSFEEDAARRDLTFNAMSMDFEGNLYDYFNGQLDLQEGVVRFVGDARQRVQEDFLRILRFFRFAARFEAAAEVAVLEMFEEPAIQAGLRTISVERYWLEMSKLFMAPDAVRVLGRMEACGVLETIGMPGKLDETVFLNGSDPAARLVAFMPAKFTRTDAEAWCREWKLSRDIIDYVVWLVANRTTQVTVQAAEDFLVDGINPDWILNWIQMFHAWEDQEYQQIVNQFIDFGNNLPVFPVRGQDLMEQGIKPGPEMGQKLRAMREEWKRSRFELTRDELLAEAP